jgi:hypothetical protein
MKAAGAGGAGTMKGKVKRDPGAMAKAGKAKAPAAARIQGPKRTGGTFSRLSGGKMSAGAGKRGKARAARVEAMAGMRKMLGRVKPGKSAEPLSTGGTLAARASLKRARAKAGAGAGPAQRGAVTRANTYAKASKARNTRSLKGGEKAGVMKAGGSAAKKPANRVSASPRRLNDSEKVAREVMTDKRFRSDRKRIAEMVRRGVSRDTDFVALVSRVKGKQGTGSMGRVKASRRR